MPSGSKKRRAAKKKKKGAHSAHVPGVDNTTPTTATDLPSSATTLLTTPGNGSESSGESRRSVQREVGVGEGVMEEKDGFHTSESLGNMVTEEGHGENGDGSDGKQTKREEDTSSEFSDCSSADVPSHKNGDFDDHVGFGGPVTVPPQATPTASSVVVEPEEVPREEVVVVTSTEQVPAVENVVVEADKVSVEEAVEEEKPISMEGGEDSVKAVEYLSVEEIPASAKKEEKESSVRDAPIEKAMESLEQKPQTWSNGVNDEQVRGTSTPGMARRTSWFSCCGLFDAFLSSDR